MNQSAQRISVVINTYNAELHLQEVLSAVKDFDEVVVCDMESTDRTVSIAQRNGCRVVTFPHGEHKSAEPARTFAIQSAQSEWVLVVDADEIIPHALRDYLYDYIRRPDHAQGLYIPRVNTFMGRFLHSGYPDYQLRFFIREGTVWPPYVHTFPTVQGRLEHIPRRRHDLAMIHLADNSVKVQLAKINEYTDDEVEKRRKRNYGVAALFYRPFARFFRSYFLKGGIRDGRAGLICAVFDGFYQFVAVSKILEDRYWRKQGKMPSGRPIEETSA